MRLLKGPPEFAWLSARTFEPESSQQELGPGAPRRVVPARLRFDSRNDATSRPAPNGLDPTVVSPSAIWARIAAKPAETLGRSAADALKKIGPPAVEALPALVARALRNDEYLLRRADEALWKIGFFHKS